MSPPHIRSVCRERVQRNNRRRTILRLFATVLQTVCEINPSQRRPWPYQAGRGRERIRDRPLWTVKLVYHGLSSSTLSLPPRRGVEQIAPAVAEEAAAEHGQRDGGAGEEGIRGRQAEQGWCFLDRIAGYQALDRLIERPPLMVIN